MEIFSWKQLNDGRLVKELDFSSFNYKGSAIPQDFYSFFNIKKDNASIILDDGSSKYKAQLNWTRPKSPVVRIFWKESFSKTLKKKFPNWKDIKPQSRSSKMYLVFKKTSNPNNFVVELTDSNELSKTNSIIRSGKTNFNFKKHSKYSRKEIIKEVTGRDENPYGKWVSGYNREGDNLFIFMNIGIPGRTGHDYKNHYDDKTETISWCAKGNTHSRQPVMQQIINGDLTLYFFARWKRNEVNFSYLGVGNVISYEDGVSVADKFGKDATCMEFQLTCKKTEVDLEDEEIKQGGLTERKQKPQRKKQKSKKRAFKGRKSPNYELVGKTNRKIGYIGEKLVLEHEKNRLIAEGEAKLATLVEHTSEVEGDGTGYDIKSFNKNGSIRFIEVKTTKLGLNADFYMSPNEIDFSKENRKNYYLYRLYNLVLKPKPPKADFYKHKGEVLEKYIADPTEFKLSPK